MSVAQTLIGLVKPVDSVNRFPFRDMSDNTTQRQQELYASVQQKPRESSQPYTLAALPDSGCADHQIRRCAAAVSFDEQHEGQIETGVGLAALSGAWLWVRG